LAQATSFHRDRSRVVMIINDLITSYIVFLSVLRRADERVYLCSRDNVSLHAA
jgi:hypothetical protein